MVPDSGTAGRIAVGAIGGGLASPYVFAHPGLLGGAMLGAGAYSKPGINLLNSLYFAQRPQSLNALATGLRNVAPYVGGGAAAITSKRTK